MIWQSKQVLKSQKAWKKPSWIGNQPKGLENKDWQEQVNEWKNDKLMMLGKLPKTKAKIKAERDDE